MNTREKMQKRDKLFNFRPVFFMAVFLCLGIVFCYFRLFYGISLWWLLLLLPVGITPFFFCREKAEFFKTAMAVAGLTVFFFGGAGIFSYQIHAYSDCRRYEGEYYVVGVVKETSVHGEITKLVLDNVFIGEEKG